MMISFIQRNKLYKPRLPCAKKELPPKPDDLLNCPWQEEVQSNISNNWQWVFQIIVGPFLTTFL